MAVVIETTLGDITVDLYLDQRPVTCLNFLKLCKMKYYNYNLFHTIRSGFIAQTGDPTGEGSGGQSVFGLLEGPEKRFFSGEKRPKIRHTDAGLISMVGTGDMMIGSQFFFTLAPDLDSLDGIHCVIGEVTEGHEVLRKLNDVICDEGHRPYRDVRITHTVVLEDPFNDPHGLRAPSRSPSPSAERLKGGRIAPDEEIDEALGKSAAEVQEMIEEKEAKARATILEIVGDLPDADIAPPENVLFVCKLNPVTTDDDLEIIFSRFGKVVSCEVIRDKKSGDSLQYAFIEFTDKKSCEEAYFKMDNVLIDDRRIHVDFSQSVSKMKWLGKGRGVKYFDGNEANNDYAKVDKSRKRSRSRDKKKNVPRYDRHDHSSNKGHDRDRESHRKHENNSNDTHRHRSRSRSRHERPKEEYRTERSKHSYDHNKNSDRNRKEHTISSKSENDKNRGNSNSHKPRTSPSRSSRQERSRELDSNNKTRHVNDKHRDDRSNKEMESKAKHKIEDKVEQYKNNKKSKSDVKIIEPRTPSPIMDKENVKKSLKKSEKAMKNVDKGKRNAKKKRKASTSSSDSSSESSSSSSESSSSSDEDRKKKTLKRRKKKYSTSSTSSSDSSSSSSSSDSSSSSSSSDRASKKKKIRKNKKKKL